MSEHTFLSAATKPALSSSASLSLPLSSSNPVCISLAPSSSAAPTIASWAASCFRRSSLICASCLCSSSALVWLVKVHRGCGAEPKQWERRRDEWRVARASPDCSKKSETMTNTPRGRVVATQSQHTPIGECQHMYHTTIALPPENHSVRLMLSMLREIRSLLCLRWFFDKVSCVCLLETHRGQGIRYRFRRPWLQPPTLLEVSR